MGLLKVLKIEVLVIEIKIDFYEWIKGTLKRILRRLKLKRIWIFERNISYLKKFLLYFKNFSDTLNLNLFKNFPKIASTHNLIEQN